MKPPILTVTEITKSIKSKIENSFSDVWITGEISNFKTANTGHCYFSLKDEGAVINAAIWKNVFSGIKYTLENGLKIIAHGRLSVYEKGGSYNIIIDYIEPEGIGELMRQFLLLKETLEKEGYFNPKSKRNIPPFPDTIGVVTSPTGAAIKDILNILQRRFSSVNVVIFPAKVQGDGAAEEIAGMIDVANQLQNVDVLIVGRGGGSYEDLWAFNERIVAEAIYRSKIPIISAVGHESDFTIADFVADMRAPTPSSAAEIVVDNKADLLSSIGIQINHLHRRLSSIIDLYKEKTSRYTPERFNKSLTSIIERSRFRLDEMDRRCENRLKEICQTGRQSFSILAEKLTVLNPLAILSRGYSIVYKPGEEETIVKTAADLKRDDPLKIHFHIGKAICRVEETLD